MRGEQVSTTMARLDETRLPCVVVEGAAQFGDARGQRVVGHDGAGPDGCEQLFLRHGLARMRDEHAEHVRRLGRETDFPAVGPEPRGRRVEQEPIEAHAVLHAGTIKGRPGKEKPPDVSVGGSCLGSWQ